MRRSSIETRHRHGHALGSASMTCTDKQLLSIHLNLNGRKNSSHTMPCILRSSASRGRAGGWQRNSRHSRCTKKPVSENFSHAHSAHRNSRIHPRRGSRTTALAVTGSEASTITTTAYEPTLKEARLTRFADHPAAPVRSDLADAGAEHHAFATFKPQRVVNLAAQAGGRYSLQDPRACAQSDLVGSVKLLELCLRATPAQNGRAMTR